MACWPASGKRTPIFKTIWNSAIYIKSLVPRNSKIDEDEEESTDLKADTMYGIYDINNLIIYIIFSVRGVDGLSATSPWNNFNQN